MLIKINNYQRFRFVNKIKEVLGSNLNNKQITLLGWSFKKDTNDSRESAAIYISYELLKLGAKIKVYDPKSSHEIITRDLMELSKGNKKLLTKIEYIEDPYKASRDSSCIGVLTEWDEFKTLNWKEISDKMNTEKLIIDGRYILKNKITSNNIKFL